MEVNPVFGHRTHPVPNKRTFDQFQADDEVPAASGSTSNTNSPSSSSENMNDDSGTRKRARSDSPHSDSPSPQSLDSDSSQSATTSASGTLEDPSPLADLLAASSTLPVSVTTARPHTHEPEAISAGEDPIERLQRSLAHSGAFDRELDLIRRPTSPDFVPTRWPTPVPSTSESAYIPQPENAHVNNNSTGNNDVGNTPSSSIAHALGPLHAQPAQPALPRTAVTVEPEDTFDLVTVATMDTESNRDRDDLSDVDMDDRTFDPIETLTFPTFEEAASSSSSSQQAGPSGISRPLESSPSRGSFSSSSDTSSSYFSATSHSSSQPSAPVQSSTTPAPTAPRVYNPSEPTLLRYPFSTPTNPTSIAGADVYDSDSSAASLRANPSVADHRGSISSQSSTSPPIDDLNADEFIQTLNMLREAARLHHVLEFSGNSSRPSNAPGNISNPMNAFDRMMHERLFGTPPVAAPSRPAQSTTESAHSRNSDAIYVSPLIPRPVARIRPHTSNRPRADAPPSYADATSTPTSTSATSAHTRRVQNLTNTIQAALDDPQRCPQMAALNRGDTAGFPEEGIDVRLTFGRNGQLLRVAEDPRPTSANVEQRWSSPSSTGASVSNRLDTGNGNTLTHAPPPLTIPPLTRPEPISSLYTGFPVFSSPTSQGASSPAVRAPLPNLGPTSSATAQRPTPTSYSNINLDNFQGPFRETMRRTIELRNRQAGTTDHGTGRNSSNNNNDSGVSVSDRNVPAPLSLPTTLYSPRVPPGSRPVPTVTTRSPNNGSATITQRSYYPFVLPGSTFPVSQQSTYSPQAARATDTGTNTSSLSPLPFHPHRGFTSIAALRAMTPWDEPTSAQTHEQPSPVMVGHFPTGDEERLSQSNRTESVSVSSTNFRCNRREVQQARNRSRPRNNTTITISSDEEGELGSDITTTRAPARREVRFPYLGRETDADYATPWSRHESLMRSVAQEHQAQQRPAPPAPAPSRQPPMGSLTPSQPQQSHWQRRVRQSSSAMPYTVVYDDLSAVPGGFAWRDDNRSTITRSTVQGNSSNPSNSSLSGQANRPTQTNPSNSNSNSSNQSTNDLSIAAQSRARRSELEERRQNLHRLRRQRHERLGVEMEAWSAAFQNTQNEGMDHIFRHTAAFIGRGVGPRPAPRSVIDGLPSGTYGQWATPGETEESCPICLDDYNPNTEVLRIPSCQHWIHRSCLTEWLGRADTCPICRAPVRRTNAQPVSVTLTTPQRRGVVRRRAPPVHPGLTAHVAPGPGPSAANANNRNGGNNRNNNNNNGNNNNSNRQQQQQRTPPRVVYTLDDSSDEEDAMILATLNNLENDFSD